MRSTVEMLYEQMAHTQFASMISLVAALSIGCGQPSGATQARSRGSAAPSDISSGPAASPNKTAGSSSTAADSPLIVASAAGGGAPIIADSDLCASARVTATRTTPTVIFLLDGSSSMNAAFGAGTRWTVLRDTLLGPTGVIPMLESTVNFGSTIYGTGAECPTLLEVQPALSNLAQISAAFPATEPGVGTPTGEALQTVVDRLPDYNEMLDASGAAPVVILATDGEPNGCIGQSAATCDWLGDLANCIASAASVPANYETTLAAVRSAQAKNIPVWIISLADGLNAIPDLQRTANIGAGLPEDASPGATIFAPQNGMELTNTISSLISQATSCNVSLSGTLDVPRACEGSVLMNGASLMCDDANGWRAVDSTHIELQGAACEMFKANPAVVLDARFPCDVIDPQ
jgi:Mg-chelatase subunit ChlD